MTEIIIQDNLIYKIMCHLQAKINTHLFTSARKNS